MHALQAGTRSTTHSTFISPYTSIRKYIHSSGKKDEPRDHSVNRANRGKIGDKDDLAAEAASKGMKEREANEWIADDTKSGATTERGGSKHAKKAKKEHPAAPEPIIGMNDERAQPY
ncbi:hypothetical protein N7532_011446 [Penicillium argentinense]|uniref:Uncharacterized protein n=1 Tax=Penicillium argentinense TaxID=1131581 RepID=A0A9W9EIF3_9EURO|nr:uncharacterized protein N7532_011446 [Penicillium argentinense]KAJ5082403.1 hypothetical protein N7532_011446 [Penicillium argentinense]